MKYINKLLSFGILLFTLLPFFCFSQNSEKQPTVALVLSGGGAKGFAHLGIIEMIDSLDIPIDYVIGTSMGGIMGGLYATGFSGKQMIAQSHIQDWESAFADKMSTKRIPVNIKDENSRYIISFPIKGGIRLPKGIIRGQKVINILSTYTLKHHGIKDFSKLPIPFSCIAVDLETGEEVELNKGFLANSLRATMSIPTIFSPAVIDNRLLVDGVVSNNFPSDIVHKKGFDYIIGVDLRTPLKKRNELNQVTDILDQMVGFLGKEKGDKNIELCDIYINPDLQGYNGGSFKREEIDSIIKIGQIAGHKAIPQLKALKKRLKGRKKKRIEEPSFCQDIHFKKITVEGLEKIRNNNFLKKTRLRKRSKVSSSELNNLIENLTASFNLDLLTFQMQKDTLKFIAHERNNNRFNVSANYNTDNKANILLNITYYNELIKNSRLSADIILGDILQFKGQYTQYFASALTLNFTVDAKSYKPNLYHNENKIANGEISTIKFDLYNQLMLWDSYSAGFGVKEEFVHINNMLSANTNTSTQPRNSWHTSYYTFIRMNTLDDRNFPTEGLQFDGEARFIFNNKDYGSGTILYGNLKKAFHTNSKFSIISQIQGRTIIDNQLSSQIFQNTWGGQNNGKYIDYHIPFLGTRWIQGLNNSLITSRLDFRYQLFPKNYVTLSGNFGRYTHDIQDIFSQKAIDLWGGGITYSYDSLIGPLSATVMQSNIVNELLLYINIGYNF